MKTTVLKRFSPFEVFEKDPVILVKPLAACELYCDGQEFIVEEDGKMPDGFCTSAWQTIFSNVRTLSFGGTFLSLGKKAS